MKCHKKIMKKIGLLLIFVTLIMLFIITSVSAVSDSNLSNNNMIKYVDVNESVNMIYIKYIPIDGLIDAYDIRVNENHEFMQETYPIKDGGIINTTLHKSYNSNNVNLTTDQQRESFLALFYKESQLTNDTFTRAVGIVDDAWFNERGMFGIRGYTWGTKIPAVILSAEGHRHNTAHEIGHTFGLCDEYNTSVWSLQNSKGRCPNGDDDSTTGLDISCIVGILGCPTGNIDRYVIPYLSTNGTSSDLKNFMGDASSPAKRWINKTTYNYLMNAFIDPSSSLVEVYQAMMISGEIHNNRSIEFDPVYWLENFTIYNTTGSGNFSIILKEGANKYHSQNFTADFFLYMINGTPTLLNESGFVFILPATENVTSVVLYENASKLGEINLSTNIPLIDADTINDTEPIFTPFNLTWNASDADNDTLYYAILVSSGNETSYTTLDIDYNQTYYEIDPQDFNYSEEYKFKVFVTDSANSNYSFSNTVSMGVKNDGDNCTQDTECASSYCDSDGVGRADNYWCFTPYNVSFDGQETAYCEYSTDNGIWQCDEREVGDNYSSCTTGGEAYFADKCNATCQGEDTGGNICRSSEFATGCTADSQCDSMQAGSENCTANCSYIYKPFVFINSPSSQWYGSNFTVNATVVSSTQNISTVKYRYENSTFNSSWTAMSYSAGDDWTATFDVSTVGDGSYTFKINATDSAGKYNSTETITNVRIDKTEPTIINYTPANNSVTIYNRPTITINYDDSGSDINTSSAVLIVNGEDVTVNATTITVNTAIYTLNYDLAYEQQHNVSLYIEDNAGNPINTSWSFNVTEPSKFIIKNSSSDITAYFETTGNLWLLGALEIYSDHNRMAGDEFIIGYLNEDVFILDRQTGDISLNGRIYENQQTLSPDESARVIINDPDKDTRLYIDEQGNVFTKGTITASSKYGSNSNIFARNSTNNLARILAKNGSLILKGTLEQSSAHSRTGNDEWIINYNSEDIFILDQATGNLYIDGTLYENQTSLNPTADSFIIKDDFGNTVGYLNATGHLFLKGTLTQSGSP